MGDVVDLKPRLTSTAIEAFSRQWFIKIAATDLEGPTRRRIIAQLRALNEVSDIGPVSHRQTRGTSRRGRARKGSKRIIHPELLAVEFKDAAGLESGVEKIKAMPDVLGLACVLSAGRLTGRDVSWNFKGLER